MGENNYSWRKLEKVSPETIGKVPFDGKTVLLADVNGNIYTGYYGGVNSGWRHNSPGRPAMWPEPTHWMEIQMASLRRPLEMANMLVKAGIDFVHVPVMNEIDKNILIKKIEERLGQLQAMADAEESFLAESACPTAKKHSIECIECGSENVSTERRMDGSNVCNSCGCKWLHRTDPNAYVKKLIDNWIDSQNNRQKAEKELYTALGAKP